jgi:hypothetical protein
MQTPSQSLAFLKALSWAAKPGISDSRNSARYQRPPGFARMRWAASREEHVCRDLSRDWDRGHRQARPARQLFEVSSRAVASGDA